MTNNPTLGQITKPHPSIKQPKRPNQVTLMPRHPTKQTTPLTDPQNKNHPKGITNSLFKLPKFQTSSTPIQTGPHPKLMSQQVKSTLNLIYSQAARLKNGRN